MKNNKKIGRANQHQNKNLKPKASKSRNAKSCKQKEANASKDSIKQVSLPKGNFKQANKTQNQEPNQKTVERKSQINSQSQQDSQNFLLNNSVLKTTVMRTFHKLLSPDPICESVPQIIQYLLNKEKEKYHSRTVQQAVQESIKFRQITQDRRQSFALYMKSIVQFCEETFQISKSLAPSCYYFYKQFCERRISHEEAQYALVTSIFTASKYHQIYPPFLDEFIDEIKPSLKPAVIFQNELQLMNLLNFSDFYVDNEYTWLEIIGSLGKVKQIYRHLVRYILKNGLVHLELYRIRPSLKAFAAYTLFCQYFEEKLDSEYYLIQQILNIKNEELQNAINLYRVAMKFTWENGFCKDSGSFQRSQMHFYMDNKDSLEEYF